MILLVHMLLGAVIGSEINNVFVAIILAFLSHYFLDLFPHIEYNIENIDKNQWQKSLPDILRVVLDFCIGIILIFIFSNPIQQVIIYTCALFSILPDGLTVLEYFFPNKILKFHSYIHREKAHFLKNKKVSTFWRLATQIVVIILSIALLKY